ncbi:hypothetical protein ACK3TF_005953 [Chlorella vulgaris]
MQAPAGLGLGLGLRAAPTIEPCRTQGLQWLFAHAPMNTLVCLLGAAVLAAALLHRCTATRRPLPNPPAAVGAGRLRPPWPVNPDKDGQAEEQLLQVEFALNDMLRHCAPSRRQKLVGAAWRLRKPGGLLSDQTDWHNKTRLVAKLPALDTCPLWQVVRIAIPASMHAQYLKAGEAGLRQLRTDVATFGRTWQYVRFMHCVTFIRNLKTRTEAAYGLRMLMAPSHHLRPCLQRRKEELRRQLLADIGYAEDLPPQERQLVESGRLAEEVLFTGFVSDGLWRRMKAEEIQGREEQLWLMACKSSGGMDAEESRALGAGERGAATAKAATATEPERYHRHDAKLLLKARQQEKKSGAAEGERAPPAGKSLWQQAFMLSRIFNGPDGASADIESIQATWRGIQDDMRSSTSLERLQKMMAALEKAGP